METAISASTFSAISFIATVASLILAVVAILLSLYFFKLSSTLAESTKEAAKEIKSGVERLEKLFDKLYEGTFSVMKDTVSDMRRHIWPEGVANARDAQEELEKKAEEKIEAFRQEMAKEVASIADRQKKADGKLETTKVELQGLVERAIEGSIEVERETKEENIRDAIITAFDQLSDKNGVVITESIIGRLINNFSVDAILGALKAMIKGGDLKSVNKTGQIISGTYTHPGEYIQATVHPGTYLQITNRGLRSRNRRLAKPGS